ncbi:MAG: hypothetical protein IKX86_05415 [Clostridia bacterium]|nr:hypothetical protein [Clostridia bacterium]
MKDKKYVLYGDGIHDDTEAIQGLIDGSDGELILPKPGKCYLISRTITLPSDFRLVLPKDATVRLADDSNCLMLMNRLTRDVCERRGPFAGFSTYIDVYSPESSSRNVELVGGIWDGNNMNQRPNPLVTGDFSDPNYNGHAILFYNVTGLKVRDVTVKDPTNFGITLDNVKDFSVENIKFDYNLGNPETICMDGVHLCGNCARGRIFNLEGTVYDDLVALNADEGSYGDICDIDIDGISAENCHSAVRILCCTKSVRNVSIKNISGSYYQYCVGITKFYEAETTGVAENILIEGVKASKAERTVYPYPDSFVFPFIYIESETKVRNLTVKNVTRIEKTTPAETFYIGNASTVDGMTIENVRTENYTGKMMPLLLQYGSVSDLTMKNVVTVSDI